MEGEPKTIDKCIGKFDQWAKWSKKDPIREIVFLIAVHILAVLSIILSPIIAIIMGNAYEKACWEEMCIRDSVDIVASCLTEWDDERSAMLMDSRSQKSAAFKVVRTWVLSFMYGCVFGAIVTLLLI